jgi:hypothetical protein
LIQAPLRASFPIVRRVNCFYPAMADASGNLTTAVLGKTAAGKPGNLGRSALAPERTATPATPLLRRLPDVRQRVIGDPADASSTILVCLRPARTNLRHLLESFPSRFVVLAPGEIPPSVTAQSLGEMR